MATLGLVEESRCCILPTVPDTCSPPYGGGKMFRAYDKTNGNVVWEMELPGGTTGAPVTYSFNGKQYIVVATGFKNVAGELIALALP